MPTYPPSDHFDGSRFFNPTNPEGNGAWASIKMIFSRHFEDWPESVENSPSLDLNRLLKNNEVAVTFVNHATVLIQSKDFAVLTDPVWSERVSPLTWIGPKRHRPPGIQFAQLPKIDFVIISHNHYDHMDLATLKTLNVAFHPRFFVPLGNKTFLERNDIQNVEELDWWQTSEPTSQLKISLTPAEHFSARGPFDKNKTLWGGYVLTFLGHTIYFAGDTAYSPHFKAIREHFGAPDLAFLPIGAYEPRWFMKVVHTNPEEAVQAHVDLGAKQSVGIHFGTFQLTNESIDQPVKDLAAALEIRKISNSEFVTLGEGRTRIFTLGTSETK